LVFISILGKNKNSKKHIHFTHSIKGNILGQTLYGDNTFPIHNRLPDLNLVSQTIFFLDFSIFFITNYSGDSSVL